MPRTTQHTTYDLDVMVVMLGNEFIVRRIKHQKVQRKYRYLLLNFLAFYK